MFVKNKSKGFTLIELLVVIAIISTLASVVLLTSQRGMGRSRDARRIQELYQLAQSLQLYLADHNEFPAVSDLNDPNCILHNTTWDAGNIALGESDPFVQPVFDANFMGNIQTKEWTPLTDGWGNSCIYRYAKVEDPCDGQCTGTYAILYAACEEDSCPRNERPACCNGSSWLEGTGEVDDRDITIFLKQNSTLRLK
ncbi:MAG: type II secretion system protein [bacterium]|nr:type II secretion system protein [bacterium]